MNLTTLVRKVQRLFGDNASEVVITQTDIFDWVDEAQLQVTRKTHCLTKSATGLLASTFPLTLPADWIMTKRLLYNKTVLKFVEIDDLDALSYDATVPVDSPSVYYIFNKQINLYPNKPNDATPLQHDYVCSPTPIATISTPLDVPLSFHEDIARYCIMRAHERNENYKAQQISSDAFEALSGERLQEASNPNEDYYVVRDDPGEVDTFAANVY